MRNKFYIFFLLVFAASLPAAGQVNQPLGILLEQIPSPPENCAEAFSFVTFDSSENKIIIPESLDTLEKFFNKTYDDLHKEIENMKLMREKRRGHFSGDRIPEGEQDEDRFIAEMMSLREDFKKADAFQVKLNETDEKFRTECAIEQEAVNNKLKKASVSDTNEKIDIVNSFLKNIHTLYEKYRFDFEVNFKGIDEICKKYNYGEGKKTPMLKKKIIEMQLEQMNNLRLLLSCSKSAIEIGSKFYVRSR